MLDGGAWLLFVGRRIGGDENDSIETVGFTGRFSHEKVPEMDWIEGPSKKSDPHRAKNHPSPDTLSLEGRGRG